MVRTGGEDLVEPTYFIKWGGGGKVVRTGGEDLVEPTYFIKGGGAKWSGQEGRI